MSDEQARPVERWKDNPYAADLGDLDVMTALREGPDRLRALVDQLTPARMAASTPGKWTRAAAGMAQCEFAFGARVRMALTEDRYAVQPFDQDAWLLREAATDGRIAFWAYYAMRHLNLQLFATLSPEERRRAFTHRRVRRHRGSRSLAGKNHLPHFETIAS
jgi:hypothetical protein